MKKEGSHYTNERNYFYRNPMLLQLHQQEVRLRSTIEAVKDSHIRQLDAIEEQKKFIDSFFDKVLTEEEIGNFLNYSDWRKDKSIELFNKTALVIKGYLIGLGISFNDADSFTGLDGIFHLRGLLDKWQTEKIESLKESFDKALSKIFDLTNQEKQEDID